MAIDETITRAKSFSISTENTDTKSSNVLYKTPTRSGYLVARKNRIERWVYQGRSSSISDSTTTASAVLGAASAQKRSESTYSQAGRVLNIHLFQLSEQRQKLIERNNFEQKLFANKQAIKYKDNQNLIRTLSYVRKCCKYTDTTDSKKDKIDPKIFLDGNSPIKRTRSRSPSPTLKRTLSANPRIQTSASMAETFIQHNRKHLQSYNSSPINRILTESKTTTTTTTDDDSQKRHVQFQIQPDGTTVIPVGKHIIRHVASANGIRSSNSSYDTRSTNSAPLIRASSTLSNHSIEQIKPSIIPKRSLSRISSAKGSLQEFREHPERFLSASNRYLPLLRRQAFQVYTNNSQTKSNRDKKIRTHISPPISRLSDGSDLTYDDAKSFLSEENDNSKTIEIPRWLEKEQKTIKKSHSPTKINLMNTVDDDEMTERRLALSRLRDREYSHLQDLIHSNPIDEILEPFSAIKTDDPNSDEKQFKTHHNVKRRSIISTQSTRIRQLSDILQSIDSLRCSDSIDRRRRRQVDIEKNRAKLGILIF